MSTMNLRAQPFLCFSPCIYGINIACFVPRFLSAAIPAFLQTSFRRYFSDNVWQHFAGVNFCHGFLRAMIANPMGKCCPFCDRVSFVHHSPISAKFAPKIFFRCVAKFFECEFLLHFPCFCGIQGGNSVHFVSGLLSTTVPRFFAKLASKFFQAMCGLHFWMQIGVFFVRFRLSSSSLLVSHPRIPMTYRAEAGRAYW